MGRWALRFAVAFAAVAAIGWWAYPRLVNLAVPAPHRPERIDFPVDRVSDARFEQLAMELRADRTTRLTHIERFRDAGIREYRGPETCLRCHPTINIPDGKSGIRSVGTRQNIEEGVHFTLNRFTGFNTYGFDGRKVEGIPMGKIDRACGVAGSFTWTGWATLIRTASGEMRSDGCGQCHAGGQYGPTTGTMFPGYRPTDDEFNAVDCLICHSPAYDMDLKYVVKDPNGRYRWNQDRSMRAAMAVGRPTSDNCLRCHEHNHGGDLYPGNLAAQHLGYRNRRLLHPGAKRGNPTRDADVHYEAGVQCLDCHESHGHLIARGPRGTDLVSNDLPGVDVSCQKCHGDAPHTTNRATRALLNAHTAKLACETCHITHLTDDNVVLRDWTDPVFDAEDGVWLYRDLLRSGKPGEAIVYRWHNGDGTFMAGALGDNPNGLNLYRSFSTRPDAAFAGFDYAGYYERTFRPLARAGVSKIAPFKRFNARMFEDMGNQGPFGGMMLPFDYNVYYETGKPRESALKAMRDPIVQEMYGVAFKKYMMDAFMHYMGIEKGWTIPFKGEIEPRWMRQDATLMLNHSITRDALPCTACHAPKERGIMPFEELGYPAPQAQHLRALRAVEIVGQAPASGR